MKIRRCQECGKRAALVNLDKLRGRVGMSYGWVHVSKSGRIRRRVRHAPDVDER